MAVGAKLKNANFQFILDGHEKINNDFVLS